MTEKNKAERLKILAVDWADPLEVTSSNPENAEVGNPNGDRVEPVARAIVEFENGARWIHSHGFDSGDDPALVDLIARIREAGEINPEHWTPWIPVYGSPEGRAEEAEIAAEEARLTRNF